jgi:hypothetical protein
MTDIQDKIAKTRIAAESAAGSSGQQFRRGLISIEIAGSNLFFFVLL